MNGRMRYVVKGEAHLNVLLGYFKILKCMEFIAELDLVSQVKRANTVPKSVTIASQKDPRRRNISAMFGHKKANGNRIVTRNHWLYRERVYGLLINWPKVRVLPGPPRISRGYLISQPLFLSQRSRFLTPCTPYKVNF